MASTLALPAFSKMAKIRSNGLGIPILFRVGENGFAIVTALHISIKFGLQDTSLWVEHEVYDPQTPYLRRPSTLRMAQSFGLSSLASIGCMA